LQFLTCPTSLQQKVRHFHSSTQPLIYNSFQKKNKKHTRTLCAGMRNVSCDFVFGKEIVKYLFHTACKTTGLRSVQANSLKSSAVTLCSVQYKAYLLY